MKNESGLDLVGGDFRLMTVVTLLSFSLSSLSPSDFLP
jgi:hypothetical protein